MGFLSGLLGGQKTNIPASGFYAMPQEYQSLYNTILGGINSNIGSINADMFTPLAQTADETRGLGMIRQGFTPTEDSLRSDISMLMNPFDDFVINDINREATGANSILNKSLAGAGQLGSNRGMLGANDIEQTRLGTIGKFRQGQYNNALSTIFNNLIPQRQQDAQGLLGIGNFERGLDSATKQAPYQGYAAQLGLLGGIPTNFGNFGSPAQTIKTGGGLGGFLGGLSNIAGLASGAGGFFSPTSLMNMGAPSGLVNFSSYF